ncbi:MAG: transcription repressor NadR [Thermotogae bacterium]|nr:transcription repressor NadR [Thermotogota bacterium]
MTYTVNKRKGVKKLREEILRSILDNLRESREPVTGTELAQRVGASRQTIVQYIAILKSRGYDIWSTPRGYVLNESSQGIRKLVAVKHDVEQIREELETVVQHGGKVLDVMVEHPVYGEIRGNLNVSSSDDIERFMALLKSSNAEPLLVLSKGVHIHTIEAPDEATMKKVLEALRTKGLLLEHHLGKEEES